MSDARVHPDARGFADAAGAYERGRPEYPAAAVEELARRLDLRAGRTVLDLAAGTGKLTRRLLATGARVLAVEPVAEMRALLPRDAEALDGVAEAIPLPSASVEAVTVGQAFHWFRPEEALREIHRVLRPGGGLALVWNTRDERDPLQRAVSALLEPLRHEAPAWRDHDPEAVVGSSGLFGPVETVRLPHAQAVDADGFVDRFLSVSFVAASPRARRDEIEAALRGLLAEHGEPLRIPYVTELYLASRT